MSNKVTPINDKKHAKTRITISSDFRHLADQQLVPITLHEFPQAATEFPIIFVKNSDSGQFQPVVMMGLKSNHNLYCQTEEWHSNFTPGHMRYYPFSLGIDEKNKQAFVCINEDSGRLSETEGNALFDEDGQQSEYLKGITKSLDEYVQQSQITQNIIKLLVEHDLLSSMNLSLTVKKGDDININGIYAIDLQKLEALSDEDFLMIKSKGLLPALYAHHGSLNQVPRLAQKQIQAEES